jgi:hypothetical protein
LKGQKLQLNRVINGITVKRELNMKQQLEQRLKELRAEFESGQRALVELEAQQMNIRSTLLRISGAIQVLEELIAAESGILEAPEQAGQNTEKAISQRT